MGSHSCLEHYNVPWLATSGMLSWDSESHTSRGLPLFLFEATSRSHSAACQLTSSRSHGIECQILLEGMGGYLLLVEPLMLIYNFLYIEQELKRPTACRIPIPSVQSEPHRSPLTSPIQSLNINDSKDIGLHLLHGVLKRQAT